MPGEVVEIPLQVKQLARIVHPCSELTIIAEEPVQQESEEETKAA